MSRPRHRRLRGGMVAALAATLACWCLHAVVVSSSSSERAVFDEALLGGGSVEGADVAPERETPEGRTVGEMAQDDRVNRDQSIQQLTDSDETSSGEVQGGVTVSTCEGEVEQVATRLLASYRDEGRCVLSQAGYLDLFGEVWGCVVYGGTWADVCVVRGRTDGHSCEVRVAHLDAELLAPLVSDE